MNQPAPTHYQHADRQRLSPMRERVRLAMFNRGWVDLREIGAELDLQPSTVASKLRDLVDKHHRYLGLKYERRSMGRGVHHYRLFTAIPEQLPLLDREETHDPDCQSPKTQSH